MNKIIENENKYFEKRLYSTDWDNFISDRVLKKIKLKQSKTITKIYISLIIVLTSIYSIKFNLITSNLIKLPVVLFNNQGLEHNQEFELKQEFGLIEDTFINYFIDKLDF